MTEPHFPAVDKVVEFAFYPYDQSDVWEPIQTPFDSGHIQVRPRHTVQRRRLIMQCRNLPPLDCQRIMGFLNERKGGGNFFYIDNLVNPVWPPYGERTLNQFAGGSYGSRNLFVAITFALADNSKETIQNQEATRTVDPNQLLQVEIPDFPPTVPRVNIYIGTATGVLYYSGRSTTPLESWQESVASTNVNADSTIGTDILFVASTAGFKIGDTIRVDAGGGGGGQEDHIIDALLTTPTRIRIEGLLQNTHTGIGGDAVDTLIGLSTQPQPPSVNSYKGEEIKVVLRNEPNPVLVSASVYELTLELEEILP